MYIDKEPNDLIDKIIKILKKHKKRAYTIKELATLTNVFPVDVEFCVRALYHEDMVNVRWKEVYKHKRLVDHKLCVTYSRNCIYKQPSSYSSAVNMYA